MIQVYWTQHVLSLLSTASQDHISRSDQKFWVELVQPKIFTKIFDQFYATIIYKQINIDILTTHDTNFVKSGFSHWDGDQDIWLH